MPTFQTPHVYDRAWQMLDPASLFARFDAAFGKVTMLPNAALIGELQARGVATLELLEDRTASTVYRIRQTGAVYQIESVTGEVFDFDEYGDYQNAEPSDQLRQRYSLGEPPCYIVARIDADKLYIKRNSPPRGGFTFTPSSGNIAMVEMFDEIIPEKMAKIMRGLGAVIAKFLKEEQLRP